MWPSSISISPDVVSMWVLRVPSPNGTSVMTWFIFIGAGALVLLPRNSSRIFRASSIHSGLRNGCFGKAVSFDQGFCTVHASTSSPAGGVGSASEQPPRRAARNEAKPSDAERGNSNRQQVGEGPGRDLLGDLVGGGQRADDEAPGERRHLVERAVDPARAVELADRRHRADDAPRQHQRVVVADEALVDPGLDV